jgi:hypothetical protein
VPKKQIEATEDEPGYIGVSEGLNINYKSKPGSKLSPILLIIMGFNKG